RYGIARVELPPLAEDLISVNRPTNDAIGWWAPEPAWDDFTIYRNEHAPSRTAQLMLRVADQPGPHGSHYENSRAVQGSDHRRGETDHALYQPGEPIQVGVSSNMVENAVVNFSTDDGLIASQTVRLDRGKARLSAPYDRRFQGRVDIMAFALKKPPGISPIGEAKVIYPARRELQVGVRLQQTSFLPGQTVAADVSVRR